MRAHGLGLLILVTSAAVHADTRRIAIVVGNNAGASSRAPLRYAEHDATKVARVLVEVGGVSPDDVSVLLARGVADVELAVAQAAERVKEARLNPETRTVMMFYFSGHSDGEALELGQERLTYPKLKAILAGTDAEVRLVIIDACNSGKALASKGAKPAEGFVIKLAETLNATGEAFITSSAADEAALESSEVMGSYFTHNFLSGLRGAADASGDKQITLAEAYRYAYERTVATTSVLPVGSQHPTYDYRLSGQGELVLTTLHQSRATLVMPESDRGLVTDVTRDQVVAEVPRGPARELALAPGTYAVRVVKGGQTWGGRYTLNDGARLVVNPTELRPMTGTVLVASKGGLETSQRLEADAPKDPLVVGVGLGVAGRVLYRPEAAAQVGPKAQLRLFFEPRETTFASFGAARLTGQGLFTALGEASFDPPTVPMERALNEGGLQGRAGYRLALAWDRVMLGLGVEGMAGVLAVLYGPDTAATFVYGLAPRFTIRGRVGKQVLLFADAEVLVHNVYVDRKLGAGPQREWVALPAVTAGMALAF